MPLLREFFLCSNLPKEEDIQFRRSTRNVAALLERNFKPFKTSDVWKLLIKCVSPAALNESFILIGGVLTIEVPHDPALFLKLNENEKKEFAINALIDGFERASKDRNWSFAPFQESINRARESRLNNEWWFGKPKINRARQLVARIRCKHGVERFVAEIVVSDRTGNVLSILPLFEEIPSDFSFVPRLGRIDWRNESEILYKTSRDETNLSIGNLNK